MLCEIKSLMEWDPKYSILMFPFVVYPKYSGTGGLSLITNPRCPPGAPHPDGDIQGIENSGPELVGSS